MDTLRGKFEALDSRDHDSVDDDASRESPPAAIGQDERRMQVRAYNHWASLLEDRNFPGIEELEPENLPDFGPYSVLLDFTAGIDNPGIAYLGGQLATECDISVDALQSLSDVPARSLLSRITDHYMQILANQAPIEFEAEFVNQRGATILYRGILLPFSTNDEKIDFIYGVINWKELADQHTSDELLLQVDQALEQKPEAAPLRTGDTPLTDWADGPGATVANDTGSVEENAVGTTDYVDEPVGLEEMVSLAEGAEDYDSEDEPVAYVEGPAILAGRAEDYLDDDGLEEEDEDVEDDALPRPKFGSLMSITGRGATASSIDDVEDEDDFVVTHAFEAVEVTIAAEESDGGNDIGDETVDDVGALSLDGYDLDQSAAPDSGSSQPDPAEMQLGDWLAAAREMAVHARNNEDRTRNALYEALGRAYDFSLAAAESPEDFDELLADSGLTVQDRAPMTPVVKLVFGADYDKTRLTEYAAALSHAHRLELPRGSLGEFLRGADGGLKGVVKAERVLRRADSGKPYDPAGDPRAILAAKLREMPAIDLAEIEPSGSEFALVMIRRSENGEIAILGEVPEDEALIEKAAKKFVG